MRSTVVLASLVLSLLMLNTASAGGTLYAVNYTGSNLLSIDPESLAITVIGPLGVSPFSVGDLAYDETSATMYWVPGGHNENLYTINLTTGAATLVGAHGIDELLSLATVDGKLYGQDWSGNFYRLDTATGVPTFLSRNYIYGGGLDWNPITEQMILLAEGGWIYSIDETGAATPLAAGEFITGTSFAYDIDRNLYWAGTDATFGEVYQYDTLWNRTQVLETRLHPAGFEYVPSSVPAPGALLLAGTGLLSLLRVRRRLTA